MKLNKIENKPDMIKKIPGNLFPRALNQRLPRASSANGVWIEDVNGNRFLDASGGAIVVNAGHARQAIAQAVYDQILAYDYIHPTMFTTPIVEELASALKAHAPKGIDRFYFHSSGSEAIEAAIKLARQIQAASGRCDRFRLIARWKSYHGLTLGALSAMGRTAFRTPYAPMLNDAVHIPPPYCLRCSYGLSLPSCGIRCALALEEVIQNMGPETVTAFLAETVSGGTLAAYPPPEGYWKIIREICDRYQVLLILDEVMCGMGRTGRWFASEHYEVSPDIVTLGKGLAGGVLALSAVGVRGAHFETLCLTKGEFVHGGTFSHHAVAAAAGLAVIRILEQENLVPRVFLWGVELVQDKVANTPFARREKIAERVYEAAFKRGVLVYKSTGLAGGDGDAFLVAPPFIITQQELLLAVDKIRQALDDIFGY